MFAVALAKPLLTDDENITISHQLIAVGLGAFTQFWAAILFEKIRPWWKFLSQVVLAGLASGALIGVLRDVAGLKIPIGGESGLASLGGWLGAEVLFGALRKLADSKGVPLGGDK
jgi:hypothetical protein